MSGTMEECDGFVLISHHDAHVPNPRPRPRPPPPPAVVHPSPPGQQPRPYTRAWIALLHSLDDKWSQSNVPGAAPSSRHVRPPLQSRHAEHRLHDDDDDDDDEENASVTHHDRQGPDPSLPTIPAVPSAAASEGLPSLTYLHDISSYVDGIAEDLWPVNKTIHDNPELGFDEITAHRVLTDFLDTRGGWHVRRSVYAMNTAWTAVYDSGEEGPVVSFNVEMGIGHACGHNLIATASVAAALATASLMRRHSVRGKIVLYGTPAEEGGGGKIKLLHAGAYRDHGVDVSLMSHPGTVADCAAMRTAAYTRFQVEYFGREAHAAAEPWLGINALDALLTAYTALSVLRQQTMPGDIIQGHITHGGAAPNIIHAYAAGVFVVRADTQARLHELRLKVDACFEAGAKATGARLTVTEQQTYADHVPNRVLARSYTRYWNELVPAKSNPFAPPTSQIPLDQDHDERRGRTRASTDQGDVSYAMPSLHVGFSIVPGPQGQGPHNPDFAQAAGTRDAFDRCLRASKALAGTAVDLLTRDGLVQQVHEAWQEDMKRYGHGRSV